MPDSVASGLRGAGRGLLLSSKEETESVREVREKRKAESSHSNVASLCSDRANVTFFAAGVFHGKKYDTYKAIPKNGGG